MKIFTIISGKVQEGAVITLERKRDITIPTIGIGEKGRNDKYSFIPIKTMIEHYMDEKPYYIYNACLINGTLVEIKDNNKDKNIKKYCICVFKTRIGVGKSNSYTGDIKRKKILYDFPGKILAKGYISLGVESNRGKIDQIIALIKEDTIFRTAYSGKLYGYPSEHFYYWDGKKMLGGYTTKEREMFKYF